MTPRELVTNFLHEFGPQPFDRVVDTLVARHKLMLMAAGKNMLNEGQLAGSTRGRVRLPEQKDPDAE
jgi:hypothetical protein